MQKKLTQKQIEGLIEQEAMKAIIPEQFTIKETAHGVFELYGDGDKIAEMDMRGFPKGEKVLQLSEWVERFDVSEVKYL